MILVASFLSALFSLGTGDTNAPLRGVDLDGDLHVLGAGDCVVTVCVFMGVECPISNRYIATLSRLAENAKERGLDFYGVLSEPGTSRSSALEYRREFEIDFDVLLDSNGEIVSRLEPTHVPEAFVLARDR